MFTQVRRPVFERWIRRECLRVAQTQSFSLVKLAALAQSMHRGPSDRVSRKRLAAALHLYAMSNGCERRLQAHIYDAALRHKQEQVAKHIGARDIQRLALRGTPMLTLPQEYRDIMQAFAEDYHAPELQAEEKRQLHQESRQLQLVKGITPTEIARAVGIAPTNAIAYLSHAAVEKITVETAREILDYLQRA